MAQVGLFLPKILKWEGGYANDPADSGGPTCKGVILDTYKAYCKMKGFPPPTVEDLKLITDLEVLAILKTMFWDKMKADEIKNQSIAELCVQGIWGSGAGYIKIIQGVLGVKRDGIVGTKTLGAINNYPNQKELFDKLWNRRKKYFEDIVARSVADYEKKLGRKATERELLKHTKKRFLKGWLNRLNDFTFSE